MFGYAADAEATPTYWVIPTWNGGRQVFLPQAHRATPIDPRGESSPFKTLRGLFFFDAWRMAPQMEGDRALDPNLRQRSQAPPPGEMGTAGAAGQGLRWKGG